MDDWAVVEAEIGETDQKTLPGDWRDAYQASLNHRMALHVRQFEFCAKADDESCLLPDALAMRILERGTCSSSSQGEGPVGSVYNKARVSQSSSSLPRSLLVDSIRSLAKSCNTDADRFSTVLEALWTEESELNDLEQVIKLDRKDSILKVDLDLVSKRRFFERLNEAERAQLFAYAVTPKESVQRISEIEGHRRALELAASVGLLTGEASLNTALSFIKESQTLLQAIRRQPLIVGFVGSTAKPSKDHEAKEQAVAKMVRDRSCDSLQKQSGEACAAVREVCDRLKEKLLAGDQSKVTDLYVQAVMSAANCNSKGVRIACDRFQEKVTALCSDPASEPAKVAVGWLIGPKFEAQHRFSKDASFSQTAIQNGLNAVIAVPAWWRNVQITVRPSWRSGRGLKTRTSLQTLPSSIVALPGNILSITDLLRNTPKPQVMQSSQFTLIKGQSAQLLIQGWNLWRGTVVTVGSQSTSDIEVLSAMDGIIARFGPITEAIASDVPVRVWTSESMVVAGTASITKEAEDEEELAIKVLDSFVVEAGKIEVKITSGKAPAGYFRARLGLRQAGKVDEEWIFSGDAEIKDGKISVDLPALTSRNYPEGTKLDVTLQIQLRTAPGENDIHLTATQKPIYYPRADAARVSVSGSGTPGSVLTLTFPANAKLAFPGLDANTRIKFFQGATPASPLPESFETDKDPWVLKVKVPDLNDKGEVKISLDPNVPKLELSKSTFPDPKK